MTTLAITQKSGSVAGNKLYTLSGITRYLESHPEVTYSTSNDNGTLVFHLGI